MQTNWRRETELVICWCETVFALVLFVLYSGGAKTSDVTLMPSFTVYGISLFPILCGMRLFYVRLVEPGQVYAWLSAIADVFILTIVIYFFSMEYGMAAASLKAPTFMFYFVLIAIHCMRFDARIVLGMGGLSAVCWVVICYLLLKDGAMVTHSYSAYVSSASVLVGAEVEKVFGLLAFTLVLGVGVRRAANLLRQAADTRLMHVKLAEAEKSAAVKSALFANMSHEIRAPMNGVLGMVQLLSRTDLRGDQIEYVKTIERSGSALLLILNDVLDFSKIEAGKMELVEDEFDLRAACRDVMTLLRLSAEEKSIYLRLDIKHQVPTFIVGDAGRVRQILINLIGNAIKFTERGHVTLTVSHLELANKASLRFSVEDTGLGIDADALHLIFNNFVQVEGSTTRTAGGTGLGLTITRSLVELMGGAIEVVSTPGRGSTFSFDLSFPIGENEMSASASTPILSERVVDTKILLVGNRKHLYTAQLSVLAKTGSQLTYAADTRAGAQAILEAERAGEPFAVLILPGTLALDAASNLIRSVRTRPQFNATHILVLAEAGLETAAWSRFGGWPSCAVLDADEEGVQFEMAVLSALAGFRALRLRGLAQAGMRRRRETVQLPLRSVG